ncbi:E3 ubiquitin-protein ligase SIAH1-like [Macrosteles quadrilineatus]|uniref:E3 ubiquitin-protein ligase SIAH1-like n=1 Tax=Macrosteles quadrilineatus TaxID=74068 RepID=UPI0023E0B757|nr:E3 ubiquitin-protein ligase SIAH1-like [Macrosteles quadrilineatus]
MKPGGVKPFLPWLPLLVVPAVLWITLDHFLRLKASHHNRSLVRRPNEDSVQRDEEKELSEKLHNVLLQLEEITKCPVCFDTLTGDVVQCISGHGICIQCRRKMNICPTCKQRFLSSKPTMLNQILEILPALCPFADRGCKEIFFPKNHQAHCEFRTFKCPIVRLNHRCNWMGAVKHFRVHFMRNHNGHYVIYSLGTSKKLFYNNFNKNWLQQEYLHSVDDNLFLVTGTKDLSRQIFVQSVRHIPLREPTNTYYFALTISSNGITYKHTTKAVPYDECEMISMGPHCMVVPLEEVGALVNEQGGLEVTFQVMKHKK